MTHKKGKVTARQCCLCRHCIDLKHGLRVTDPSALREVQRGVQVETCGDD